MPTSVEVSTRLPLRSDMTLLLASEGLFDNLHWDEIIPCLMTGDLLTKTERLVQAARQRMSKSSEGPCKPDDLTVITFRRLT